MNHPNVFVFEGPDGSGKSTITKKVYQYLKGEGWKVVHMVHPGETPLGVKLREIFIDKNIDVCLASQVAMIIANRQQTILKMKQYIDDGYIVLIERWDLSTLIYQAAQTPGDVVDKQITIGRIEEVMNASLFEETQINPAYIITDASDPILNNRVNSKNKDRFESMDLDGDFHNFVRKSYSRIEATGKPCLESSSTFTIIDVVDTNYDVSYPRIQSIASKIVEVKLNGIDNS